MLLEHQVCTLEQAKKFDELGVTAESYFVWIYGSPISKKSKVGWWLIARDDICAYSVIDQINAYSCAELGVLLRADIGDGALSIAKSDHKKPFYALYENINGDNNIICESKHEAHAKADLLFCSFEQKSIKPEDLKL